MPMSHCSTDAENAAYILTQSQWASIMKELGQPSFRAKQIHQWIHGRHVYDYASMTNLPKSLRDSLQENHPLSSASVRDKQISKDGTRKYILSFPDGTMVETVGIPSSNPDEETTDRLTVCVSSQVGCPMACKFCATGKEGFTRNLSAFEMIQQVACVADDFGERVTNVVVMGQGEPFLNFEAVKEFLERLNDPDEFNIGARRITVSSCGIISGIEQFALLPEQFTLAISLHSAVQQTRDELMPHTIPFPLEDLKESLRNYISQTNRRITFEYILIKGINDSSDHLSALIEYCKGLLCHVNLIPINATDDTNYEPSSMKTVLQWQDALSKSGIEATMRHSRGADIAGACGQLKNAIQIDA